MRDMSGQDAERLHAIITRHAHYTNSAKAKTILADWPTWQKKFRKVMPVDYRRALEEMAKHQRRRLDRPRCDGDRRRQKQR